MIQAIRFCKELSSLTSRPKLKGAFVLRVLIVLGLLLLHLDSLHGQTTGPEKGVLLIHGGGSFNIKQFIALAKETSGKQQPVIRIISIPKGKRRQDEIDQDSPLRMVTTLEQRYGLENASELFTLSKKQANAPDFFEQIDSADAVYLTGGNQTYLADAFLETESLAALQRLLDRGGLIGGTSAGAQVQSSFMTRGDYRRRAILGDAKHQTGFAFIKNSVFDVHVEERNREKHLLQVFRADKSQLQDKDLNPLDLLGIGIDQGTAIVVKQNQFQVTGKGQVYIFDAEKWDKDDPDSWTYQTLKSGTHFDMKLRKVIAKEATPKTQQEAKQPALSQ